MTDPVSRHPEVETMAAFVEGTLAGREREAVLGHLRNCSDCRTVAAESAQFYDEEQPAVVKRPSFAHWVLAAAAILALALLTMPLLRDDDRAATHIATLIDAAPRSHRTVAARVSGFPWARLQAPVRGDDAPANPEDLQFGGVAGNVLQQTSTETTAEAQHAAGVAYLLIDRAGESVAALERAARESNDARVWNDLAAAHSALASDHASHLAQALRAADRALQLDPKLPEAHFNRALILERLGDRNSARKAWQQYLAVDPSSDWSNEARAHLRSLGEPTAAFDFERALRAAEANVNELTNLTRAHPEEARRWGEATLLGRWADAQLTNDATGATRQLAIVRTISAALADRLLGDAVAAIDRADSARRNELARAQQIYVAGRRDYAARKAAAAEEKLRRAAELYRRGGSPLAGVATYYAAQTVSEQRTHDLARAELTRLFSRIDRTRHRALAAQVQWQLALLANMANDRTTAAREAAAAAATFRELGEPANAAQLEAMAALALERLGDRDAAWQLRLRALGSTRWPSAVLHSAALSLAAIGDAEAAASILNLVDYPELARDPVTLAESLAAHARILARIGNASEAQRRLGDARAASAKIQDAALRNAIDAQIEFADAALETGSAPLQAAATAGRALSFFRERGLGNFVSEAFLQRARALRAQGDDDAAADDYAAALDVVDAQRGAMTNEHQRLAFLDTAAQVVEDAIELHLGRNDVARAFAIVERTRTLAPRDEPLVVPQGVAIAEYVVLPRSVVIFVATSDGLRAERVAIERNELGIRVSTLAEAIRGRGSVDAIQRAAAVLHRLLIAPLRLASVDELVIVPDRELYALPFAALYDPARQRYLAQEVAIRFAPSAHEGIVIDDGALSPALVVADPRNMKWRRLEHARAEAEEIARGYGAPLLADDAATPRAFTEAIAGSAVVHYAGHADSDASASYGALVLADGEDSGILGADDVARLPLARRPLVVLAACGTFRGDALHVGGMSSIARSFLAAGARAVIGTLWEIDDDAAAPLFRQFHLQLRGGAQPARALRSAQLAMLASADPQLRHPATWSVASCIAVHSKQERSRS